MKKLNRNNGGFSFVELIVAIAILGIIVVPLLHTLLTGARTARLAADTQSHSAAAESLMETVKAAGAGEVYSTEGKLGADEKISENLTDGIKTIEFSDFISGERHYRAVVKIEPFAEKNTAPLAKNSPMDINFNMKYADSEAKSTFSATCRKQVTDYDEEGNAIGSHYEYADASWLKRSGLDLSTQRTEVESGVYDYTVTLRFDYSFDAYNGFPKYSGEVSRSATVRGVSLPAFGDAAFSVYIMYYAYFQKEAESLNITNPYSDSDFNVFLVSASDADAAPLSFECNASYKQQRYLSGETCVRVFANFPLNKYWAYNDGGVSEDLTSRLTNSLVETAPQQRRYKVGVSLFEPQGTEPLHSLAAEMMV